MNCLRFVLVLIVIGNQVESSEPDRKELLTRLSEVSQLPVDDALTVAARQERQRIGEEIESLIDGFEQLKVLRAEDALLLFKLIDRGLNDGLWHRLHNLVDRIDDEDRRESLTKAFQTGGVEVRKHAADLISCLDLPALTKSRALVLQFVDSDDVDIRLFGVNSASRLDLMPVLARAMSDTDRDVARLAEEYYAMRTAARTDLDLNRIPEELHDITDYAAMWGHGDQSMAKDFALRNPGAARLAVEAYRSRRRDVDRWLRAGAEEQASEKEYRAFKMMRQVAKDYRE